MFKLKLVILCVFWITQCSLSGSDTDTSKFLDGDIIFQETKSEQGKAIQIATKSRYTHVGVLFRIKGKFKVIEAVEPVRITNFETFIKRGKNKHFVVKRIKNRDNLLNPKKISEMRQYGFSLIGRHYDPYFEWKDDRIYCTELVWKMYQKILSIELSPLTKLKDFDLDDPLVQTLMKKRYGNKIPLNENVISPSDLFDSDQLTTILEKN
ncbi:YiiX family permuted papain-like enzyme [Leptospira sp. WS92.C1]